MLEQPTFDTLKINTAKADPHVVDVPELENDDVESNWDNKPVLPRVAGHVPEFHPDFVMQGLSPVAATAALDEYRRTMGTSDEILIVIDLAQQRVRLLMRDASLAVPKPEAARVGHDLKAILEAADLAKLKNFYEKRFFI